MNQLLKIGVFWQGDCIIRWKNFGWQDFKGIQGSPRVLNGHQIQVFAGKGAENEVFVEE